MVYEGLELFRKGERLHSALEAPGVAAGKLCNGKCYSLLGGWKLNSIGGIKSISGTERSERDRDLAQSKLVASFKTCLDKVVQSKHAWPFLKPITEDEVPGYSSVIRNPMDLSTISARLHGNSSGRRGNTTSSGDFYRTREMLYADLMLMVSLIGFERCLRACRLIIASSSMASIQNIMKLLDC